MIYQCLKCHHSFKDSSSDNNSYVQTNLPVCQNCGSIEVKVINTNIKQKRNLKTKVMISNDN